MSKYYLQGKKIVTDVLGEPLPLTERQVQDRIDVHRREGAFMVRADPEKSRAEYALAKELEVLQAQIYPVEKELTT